MFSSQDEHDSLQSPFMNSSKKTNNKNYNNLFQRQKTIMGKQKSKLSIRSR